MVKLIKISAHDCPICAELATVDIEVAQDYGMPVEVKELSDLAQENGALRDYVVGYHLDGEGAVIVPIYVIMDGLDCQASGEVKEEEELRNLINAWQTWKATQ